MSISSDARFWDRSSRRYAKSAVADRDGYARTLDRTRSLLRAGDHVLELGCGTGSTAMLLAGDVKTYLATDFSPAMIAIAEEKRLVMPIRGLDFLTATADAPELGSGQFEVVLGFNYLHLVRDLPQTLRRIHTMLASDGLFVSKTPCLGDMNPLIRLALLPVMRATGLAPHAGAFSTAELVRLVASAGFEIVATENHATKGNDVRPYIVARKR
jgi:ubiquinone/menaquinone biosynthesis C-methylase UbiE